MGTEVCGRVDHCIQGGIGYGDGGEGGGHGRKGKAEAARVAPVAAAHGGVRPARGSAAPNPLPPWLLGDVEEPFPL